MAAKTLITESTLSELIVHVDHKWSPYDFSVLFDSIERLYNYNSLYQQLVVKVLDIHNDERLALEYLRSLLNEDGLSFLSLAGSVFEAQRVEVITSRLNIRGIESKLNGNGFVFQFEPALVNKIRYGSKGSIDIIGIGKFFESIKELLFFYFPNEEKKVDAALKRRDLELKEQELIARKIDNYEKMGYTKHQIQIMMGHEAAHLQRIQRLIDEGRVVEMEIKNQAKLE